MKSVMRGQVRFGEQSVVRASPSAFAHATQMANASAGRWSLTGWLGSLMPASTAPTTETPPPAPNPAQARNFPRSTEAAVQSSDSAAAAARPSPSQPASSRSVSAPVLSSTYTIDIEPHITRSAGPASTDLAPGSPLWASLDDATRTMLLYLREGSAKEAAGWRGKKLQARIRQLTADGEADKAFPLLCERALRAFSAHGAESADTVLAVCSVAENTFQRSFVLAPLHCWLLPRYAQHFGIGHATTRALVLRAALEFCHPEDPRHPPEFLRVVTDLAQRLPGVLGWGSRVVAPVPDEQAYQMHVIMQAQAAEYMSHNDRLAKDMLQQCVTYYQSLGPHWLGTVRKVAALMHIGSCVRRLEGAKAAEPYKLAAKRAAQQQLGKKHPKTLEVMWDVSTRYPAHTHTHTRIHTHTHTDTHTCVCLVIAFKAHTHHAYACGYHASAHAC